MRKGLLVFALVAVSSVGAGTAFAAAQAGTATGRAAMHDEMRAAPMGPMTGSADMDAMHRQLRDLMPADARAACDEAHARMNDPTSPGAPMPGAHADHHGAGR